MNTKNTKNSWVIFISNSIYNIIQTYKRNGSQAVFLKFDNLFWKLRQAFFTKYHTKFNLRHVTARGGVKMKPNFGDNTFEYDYFGDGLKLLNILKSIHKNDFIFIDIGANQGYYSLLAAKNKRCKQVISIEPVSSTFNLLKYNIKLNRFTSKIIPLNYAIAAEENRFFIHKYDGHSGIATMRAIEAQESQYGEWIETKPASSLEELLLYDGIVFCKIDVEGYEEPVIRSLIQAKFFHRIEAIIYEVDENWVNPISISNLLMESGNWTLQKIGQDAHYDILAIRKNSKLYSDTYIHEHPPA